MGHFSQNRRYRKGSLHVSLAQSHFPCAMGKTEADSGSISLLCMRCHRHAVVTTWHQGTGMGSSRTLPRRAPAPMWRKLTGCKTRKVRPEDHPWPQQHLQHLVKKCTFSRPAPDLPNPTLQGTPSPATVCVHKLTDRQMR